jgi:phospholipid/cholesterol/gamma-HCH transport system substrate-binding protein
MKVLALPEKLLKLREECAKQENEDKTVCKQLALIPGLPTQDTPSIPITQLTSILTSLPSITLPPLLPRPGTGTARLDYGSRGPTMQQLMDLYDPDLVSLLVPGMVLDGGTTR